MQRIGARRHCREAHKRWRCTARRGLSRDDADSDLSKSAAEARISREEAGREVKSWGAPTGRSDAEAPAPRDKHK